MSKWSIKMNILEEIAQKRVKSLITKKAQISTEQIKQRAQLIAADEIKMYGKYNFLFEKNLLKEGINFICEVKKASPSKGVIVEDFPYVEISKEYEKAGAAAISVLTEPEYFFGKDEYLQEIAANVDIPVLRKDFIIDEYQIYEAKVLGASAILLICTLLDDNKLNKFIQLTHELGMSALVETHDADEVKMALAAGARIIGVNNRDLKTFTVDVNNSVRLRKMVSDDIVFVSESGISTAEDISILKANKTNAVLIGEAFMKCNDKAGMLKILKGESV